MNSLQKRQIALLAYSEIKKVICKWENIDRITLKIDFGWNGYISVEGETFGPCWPEDYKE